MITFVGIHYLPGKTALDSSTPSGKKIDEVIRLLGCECRKANLFQGCEIPNSWHEIRQSWSDAIRVIKDTGVIVLLGKDVQKYFPYHAYKNAVVLKYRHPSFSPGSFAKDLAELVKNAMI